MRQGYFPKRKRTGFLDWAYLYSQLPNYRDEIYRKRRDQKKLRKAVERIANK
jgi:hypothetical protein